MVETALKIFLCVGISVGYILALIAETMVWVKILWRDDAADDIDYIMTANVIQFFVMVAVIARKVGQWIN